MVRPEVLILLWLILVVKGVWTVHYLVLQSGKSLSDTW